VTTSLSVRGSIMLMLVERKPGQSLVGLEPNAVATVVAVVPIAANAVRVIYTTPDGTLKDRPLNSADEPEIGLATTDRPWSFDGDGATFQLTCEAKRIDLAFLFDPMMAVHTSNVDPLPHQITAVYESMLPRQPLRFVLADDPGAGKTIMAGLYIRELVLRASTRSTRGRSNDTDSVSGSVLGSRFTTTDSPRSRRSSHSRHRRRASNSLARRPWKSEWPGEAAAS
jgi:hypothetical protein